MGSCNSCEVMGLYGEFINKFMDTVRRPSCKLLEHILILESIKDTLENFDKINFVDSWFSDMELYQSLDKCHVCKHCVQEELTGSPDEALCQLREDSVSNTGWISNQFEESCEKFEISPYSAVEYIISTYSKEILRYVGVKK